MDTMLMGKINPDGWVTINFIPTAAHTIWGALAGSYRSGDHAGAENKNPGDGGADRAHHRLRLDLAGVTPIIKRIATASFTLASGGWVMLVMALLYWIMADVKQNVRYARIATVVGMNAIFIYSSLKR